MNENFEDLLESVETTLSKMDGGQLTLDQTIKHYENAIKTLKKCDHILSKYEKKLRSLEKNENGELEEATLATHKKSDGLETEKEFVTKHQNKGRKKKTQQVSDTGLDLFGSFDDDEN